MCLLIPVVLISNSAGIATVPGRANMTANRILRSVSVSEASIPVLLVTLLLLLLL